MTIDITVVTNAVLTLFLLIITGYAARKLKIIDADLSKKLSNLVIVIGQPFMLIGALLKNDYSPELLKTGLTVTLIALGAHTLLAVFAHIFVLGFKEPDERKILEFSMVFANCAFIGFPILEAAFGPKGLFYGSFYVIAFNIFMWSYGMILLGRNRSDIKISPLKMFVNYGTTPCIAGLCLYALQLNPPVFFMNAASFLGSICTPLSTLVIGGLLATCTLREIFLSGKIYLFCFIKLLALPTLMVLIAKLINLPDELIYLAAIMSALPTAANTAMFAEIYDIKPSYAAQAVGLSSLLSVITIPMVIFITRFII
jgi:predicted permease